MYFNISFDLISLLVLLVLTVRFFTLQEFPVFSNRMYGLLLILGIASLSFDILGNIVVEYASSIPLALAYIPNVLYYILQFLLSASLTLYLIALLENKKHIKKRVYLFAIIPCVICTAIFAVGMIAGQVFTISPEGMYEYGPLSLITYVCVSIYLVFMFSILFGRRKYFSKRDHFSISILGLFIILTSTLQKFFPQQLLSGSAIALAFLIMYFSIQDPQLMLDASTGLFNSHAFAQLIDNGQILRKECYIAAFKLHGLHNIYVLKGKEVGDATLKIIGNYLHAYKSAWSFRVGDAVFATCFKSKTDLNEFVKQFEQLRSTPFTLDQGDLPVLTLIVMDHDGKISTSKDVLAVIGNAFDKRNVQSIKNQTTYLSKEQIAFYRRNIDIENEIRQSLKDGTNFLMHYQPIYSLSNNRFVSAEALVRYQSSTLNRLSPAEFVPMIETKGLAQELDEVVVKKVFEDAKTGIFRDLQFQTVHINLSASTFASEKSIEKIVRLAKDYHIDCSKIIFEMTETATTLSNQTLEKCVARLAGEGFRIAIDDFGVGYANIGRLYKLPFSTIKLDRCLVTESAKIFKDIVGIFKTYMADIVAEGVETQDQVELVKNSGVDLIQGFYFAKPMPCDQLIPFIEEYSSHQS